MADNQLIAISKAFAVQTIDLCDKMKSRGKAASVINQMLRSGTSIGANIHEANYASSRADFINKLQISLKECYETDYWLDVFHDSSFMTEDEYTQMSAQCSKIRRLLVASITTAKKNVGAEK